jgi:hypothetical protein
MNPRLRALAQRVVASSFARSGMFVFAAVILGNAVNYAYLLLLGRLLSNGCRRFYLVSTALRLS